ncbi:MAG: DUF3048 domain-containing protein, partial [Firmicutes bacterium]|nr:DUF3048 domain-containing protein [Bacillota bacterium]
MKKKSVLAVLLILALALGLALTGCSSGDDTIDPGDLQPGSETEEAEGGEEGEGEDEAELPPAVDPAKPKPVYYYNPLTGERTMSDISKLRPYAVMLNNKREALPQLGVSQADIIYEVCAEGGIT